MNPSSSSSQRLPSFRDVSDVQKVVLPFNKNTILGKKTYVPNLNLSRNIQARSKAEDKTVEIKKELSGKETRRSKPERKIIAAAETFVPQSDTSRSSLPLQSKSKIIGASSSVKHENVDRLPSKEETLSSQLVGKFETLTSSSSYDLPVPIHQSCSQDLKNTNKVGLLTNIMKPSDGESPLFLLKTPKYIPAVLDESKDHPKISTTERGKGGFKCTIHDLPDGQIGKLQILKSGKLRLILGDCKFWLHQGVKVNFKEELAVVKADKESRTGEIISLGPVQERVIVIPDTITKLDMDI